GWVLFRSERRTVPVLSSFVSAKSGAASPTWTVPARACVHIVSNGQTRNTSQGKCIITRPNSSGERCIVRHMKATNPAHSTNTTTRTRAVIFNQRRGRLGFSEIASTIVLIFLTFTNALSFRAEQIVREADDAESRDLLSLLSQRSVPNIKSLRATDDSQANHPTWSG